MLRILASINRSARVKRKPHLHFYLYLKNQTYPSFTSIRAHGSKSLQEAIHCFDFLLDQYKCPISFLRGVLKKIVEDLVSLSLLRQKRKRTFVTVLSSVALSTGKSCDIISPILNILLITILNEAEYSDMGSPELTTTICPITILGPRASDSPGHNVPGPEAPPSPIYIPLMVDDAPRHPGCPISRELDYGITDEWDGLVKATRSRTQPPIEGSNRTFYLAASLYHIFSTLITYRSEGEAWIGPCECLGFSMDVSDDTDRNVLALQNGNQVGRPTRTTRSRPVTTTPPPVTTTPPPVTDPTTTTSVTSAQLQAMIKEGVTAALAARDTTRNGTEGVCLDLTLDDALTWWNAHVKTTTPEAAHAMPWATLKKKMTDKYCPKKLRTLPEQPDSSKQTKAKPGRAYAAGDYNKRDCPKLKNNNNRGNRDGNAKAPTKVYAVGNTGANPDNNVVTNYEITVSTTLALELALYAPTVHCVTHDYDVN
ncbi:hypothetical protein Tco_0084640 [Tanacetum coccineum]